MCPGALENRRETSRKHNRERWANDDSREVERLRHRQYRANDPEATKERDRRGHEKRAEAERDYNRQYRADNAEAVRERERRYRAENAEAVKERNRKYFQTPKGREVSRFHDNKRRDLEEGANYTDLRHLDNGVCYICGQWTEKPDIEHVIPLSKWKAAVASDGVTESAWRTGCYDCNRGVGGKFETDHSAYLMRRFRAGLPLKPPHLDGMEPSRGVLTPQQRRSAPRARVGVSVGTGG